MGPLALAVTFGNFEIIKLLVEVGKADVNHKTETNESLEDFINNFQPPQAEEILQYLQSVGFKK